MATQLPSGPDLQVSYVIPAANLAELQALNTGSLVSGVLGVAQDTNNTYQWTGTSWLLRESFGAAHFIDPPLAVVIDNQGAGTVYIAEATIGTLQTASLWRVHRNLTASGRTVTTWVDSGKFTSPCNSTAVLAALSYT